MQLALDAQASVARTRDVFFEALSNLPAGVSEIFAHPVLDGDELRGYDLNNAGLRVHDAVCLIDVTLQELIEQRSSSRSAIGRWVNCSGVDRLAG